MKIKNLAITLLSSLLIYNCANNKEIRVKDDYYWTVANRLRCDVSEIYSFGSYRKKSYISKKYLRLAYEAIAEKNPQYLNQFKSFKGTLTSEDKKILSDELWKIDLFPFNSIIEPDEISKYKSKKVENNYWITN